MPLIRADRVKESSTSTGTSALLLNGADSTYRTFASVCAVGDTVYYAIAHRSANEWEVGLGTYSATNTLTRTTVHASSNANAAVAFSSGTKDVLLALTKTQLETYATLAGTETLTNKTISGANNTITNVSLTTGATGTLPLANGGTGTTTAQLAINALAGAVTSGSYLRGNGTNIVMATIAAGDVPTLNQNTTGTASGSVSGTASYVPKFTGTNVVGNSLIYDSGSHIGIGTTTLNQVGGTRTVSINGSGDAAVELNANNVMAGLLYGNPNGLLIAGYGAQGVRFWAGTTSASATERMRIDSTGNVGIGTASPSGKLHVRSSGISSWVVYATNSTGNIIGGIYENISGHGSLYVANSSGTYQAVLSSVGESYVLGDLGVGTSSPGAKLQVTTAAAATKGLIVKGASAQSANLLELQNSAGTALAVVDASGNVGIGAAPVVSGYTGYRLQVGNGTDSQTFIVIGNSTSGLGPTNGLIVGNDSGNAYLMNNENTRLRIGNNGSDHFVIDATGAVGINQFTPGAQLHVTTSAAATKGLIVRGASAQSASLLEAQASAGTSLFKVYPNASGDTLIEGNTGTASRNAGFYLYNQTTASGSACGIAYQSVAGFTGYSGVGAYFTASATLYVHTNTASDIVFVPSNVERMRITSAGNVGIGTTSPSDKLHVIGNVRAGNYTYGYLAMTGDLPGYANGAYPTLKSDQTIYFSADGKYSAYLGDASKNVFGLLHPTTGTGNVLLNPNGTSYFAGGSVAFGATTAPAGQLYVAPQAAATKGLVVRGASAQNANLQEWQSSTGSVLAYVNSAGDIWGAGGGIFTGTGDANGYGESGPNVGVNKWLSYSSGSIYFNIRKLYGTRAFPATYANGDYVEIAKISRQGFTPITLTIHAGHGAVNGAASKVYVITPDYNFGNWTAAPLSGGKIGDFDFDVELVAPDPYTLTIRVRRHSSSTPTYANIIFTIEGHNYNRGGMAELSGTGNSASALPYRSDYMRIGPTVSAPPPVGGSGAGTDLAIYGGSAIGTGAGGSIILQPGAQATSGGDGTVISRRGANGVSNIHHFQVGTSTYAFIDSSGRLCITPEVSTTVMPVDCGLFVTPRNNANTIGVVVRGVSGQAGNLQQWQNNAGTVLSAINSAGSFTNTGGYSFSEEFGNGATVTNQYATAIGYGTTAGQLSTAVGSFATTSGVTSTAIGADANADGGSTAVGRQASASGGSATAIGVNASAVGNNSIAIGRLVASNGGVSIGYNFAGAGLGYTSFCASLNGTSTTGAIAVYAGDGASNGNFSRQHSVLGTWATATYASRLGRVQLRVNDYTTDREAIRYESDGANALTSIGGSAIIANTTLAVQPAVSGNKGIVVKGASGQSANLLELQNSSGQIGLSVSVNQFGEATFVNGPRYISTAPEFSAGLLLQFQDSTIDRLNVKMHGTGSIGFAALSASNTSLDTYVSRGAAGVLRVNAASGAGGSIAITSNTPSAFTADQNNLALTASGFQRLSGTAARNITGIAPPSGSHVDGRMIRIYNVGTFNLTLKHNSTSSTAANRFWNVQAIDIIVGANDYAELIYDGTNNGSGAAGWRVA